jgi:hypothetical protein
MLRFLRTVCWSRRRHRRGWSDGSLLHEFRDVECKRSPVIFSPTGLQLICGCVWDLSVKSLWRKRKTPSRGIRLFSPRGHTSVASSSDGKCVATVDKKLFREVENKYERGIILRLNEAYLSLVAIKLDLNCSYVDCVRIKG